MIPVDWEVVRLKQLLIGQVKNGFSPNCVEEQTGRYILGLGNLTENGLNLVNLKNIPVNENRVTPYLLKDGDFLISRSNTCDKVGRCALFRGYSHNCYYPDLMMRFRVIQSEVVNGYLEKYLQSSFSQKYFQRHASGTSGSMVKITKSVVEKAPIILPSLSEQKAIVDLLTIWDEAIEKTERLIKAKEKRLNSLYQHFFIPGNSYNSHWIKIKMGKLLKPRNKMMIPTEERPLFSLTIENGVTEKTDRYNREALVKDHNSKKYKVVCPDDIVFNPANLRWGAIARSKIPHEVLISPIYEVLCVKHNIVDIDFLTHLITCPRQIGIYATKTEGTLVERMAVKVDAFLLLDIFLPNNREEQIYISQILNTAQQEIDLLKKLSNKYKTQKRGLMQKLLTVEWRVKIDS